MIIVLLQDMLYNYGFKQKKTTYKLLHFHNCLLYGSLVFHWTEAHSLIPISINKKANYHQETTPSYVHLQYAKYLLK